MRFFWMLRKWKGFEDCRRWWCSLYTKKSTHIISVKAHFAAFPLFCQISICFFQSGKKKALFYFWCDASVVENEILYYGVCVWIYICQWCSLIHTSLTNLWKLTLDKFEKTDVKEITGLFFFNWVLCYCMLRLSFFWYKNEFLISYCS